MLQRMSEVFDLPGEVLEGIPKLSLTGNRRLHIEGHKGMLEYDSSIIAINGGETILRVYGHNLEILSMNAEELLIAGNIVKVEFEQFI
jgi:sporulation protein YqfC